MKSIDDFIKTLQQWEKNIDNQIMEAQQKTAQQIHVDIIENAPVDPGTYRSSIKVSETTKEKDEIKTFIGSDMFVGPTKWTMGKTYNLGYLLEHGTYEHAIPNAFGYGFYYGFTSKNGTFHKGTLDSNWHPGSIARPHFSLALEKNKELIKKYIVEEWRQ